MAQRVTLSIPNPADGSGDINFGTAANPIVTTTGTPSGTSSTKREDTPAADQDYGSASLWVRSDTNVSSVSANRDYINPVTDQYGNNKTVQTPTDSAGAAIVPVASAALTTGQVLKASAGNLYGYNVLATVAGYLMIFNSTTVPADGAVTPLICLPLAAGAGVDRSFDIPRRFTTGITLVFSSTGPYTKTASATAFLGGAVQ